LRDLLEEKAESGAADHRQTFFKSLVDTGFISPQADQQRWTFYKRDERAIRELLKDLSTESKGPQWAESRDIHRWWLGYTPWHLLIDDNELCAGCPSRIDVAASPKVGENLVAIPRVSQIYCPSFSSVTSSPSRRKDNVLGRTNDLRRTQHCIRRFVRELHHSPSSA
jgi:hypothetical protein